MAQLAERCKLRMVPRHLFEGIIAEVEAPRRQARPRNVLSPEPTFEPFVFESPGFIDAIALVNKGNELILDQTPVFLQPRKCSSIERDAIALNSCCRRHVASAEKAAGQINDGQHLWVKPSQSVHVLGTIIEKCGLFGSGERSATHCQLAHLPLFERFNAAQAEIGKGAKKAVPAR